MRIHFGNEEMEMGGIQDDLGHWMSQIEQGGA